MTERMKLMAGLPRPITHSCPTCSAPVRCDVELGKSTCWCFGLQAKEVEHGDVCLCSSCLTRPQEERK